MTDRQQRFDELDAWRGMAIIAMVIFHFFFVLHFLGIQEMAYREGGWHILGQFARLSFLVLVGIGLQLSYQRSVMRKETLGQYRLRQFKRGLFVLFCGMVVSFITLLAIGENGVRFGVLHLIGTAIILLSTIAHRPWLSVSFAIVIYSLAGVVTSLSSGFEPFYILGIQTTFYPAIDYFPIFPWLAWPALGIWIGHLLFRNYRRQYVMSSDLLDTPVTQSLAAIGKKSLLIYMVHVPIIVLLVWLLFGITL